MDSVDKLLITLFILLSVTYVVKKYTSYPETTTAESTIYEQETPDTTNAIKEPELKKKTKATKKQTVKKRSKKTSRSQETTSTPKPDYKRPQPKQPKRSRYSDYQTPQPKQPNSSLYSEFRPPPAQEPEPEAEPDHKQTTQEDTGSSYKKEPLFETNFDIAAQQEQGKFFLYAESPIPYIVNATLDGLSLNEGDPAPDFTLKDFMTGEDVTLSGYKERIVIIQFWATWCGICKRQIPFLVDHYNKYKYSCNIEVLTILLPSGPSGEYAKVKKDVESLVKKYNITYKILDDKNKFATDKYGLKGMIPVIAIVDPYGNLYFSRAGEISVTDDPLPSIIEKLCNTKEWYRPDEPY